MLQKLRDCQQANGAQIEGDIDVSVVSTFGQDQPALAAAVAGVALCDRTHWPLLELRGEDCKNFLHNQSTNDIKVLQAGQGCDTVILTSTARMIDLVSAFVTGDSVLLLASPNRGQQLLKWFDRYIFFGDKVEVCDRTNTLTTFSLLGPQSASVLEKLSLTAPGDLYQHQQFPDLSVCVAAGSGLSMSGYTLIVAQEQASALWQHLTEAGAVPMGANAWEQFRIMQGRPSPDAELTEDYNPLEAGLWHTVSFEKGCYIGQETIARLNTYNGVKQQLWGIQLSAAVEPSTPIHLGEQKVGVLTSSTQTGDGYFGLGYIKTKAGGADLQVQVGDATGTVVEVPFLTRAVPSDT